MPLVGFGGNYTVLFVDIICTLCSKERSPPAPMLILTRSTPLNQVLKLADRVKT